MKKTMAGVDLAKKVIQVCVVQGNKVIAIVQASQLIDIKFINGKSFKQQELQSIMRMRELAV